MGKSGVLLPPGSNPTGVEFPLLNRDTHVWCCFGYRSTPWLLAVIAYFVGILVLLNIALLTGLAIAGFGAAQMSTQMNRMESYTGGMYNETQKTTGSIKKALTDHGVDQIVANVKKISARVDLLLQQTEPALVNAMLTKVDSILERLQTAFKGVPAEDTQKVVANVVASIQQVKNILHSVHPDHIQQLVLDVDTLAKHSNEIVMQAQEEHAKEKLLALVDRVTTMIDRLGGFVQSK